MDPYFASELVCSSMLFTISPGNIENIVFPSRPVLARIVVLFILGRERGFCGRGLALSMVANHTETRGLRQILPPLAAIQ